jgi:hypothetical protein
MLTAGIVADLLGKDPVTAAEVARNAAENNFLNTKTKDVSDYKKCVDSGKDCSEKRKELSAFSEKTDGFIVENCQNPNSDACKTTVDAALAFVSAPDAQKYFSEEVAKTWEVLSGYPKEVQRALQKEELKLPSFDGFLDKMFLGEGLPESGNTLDYLGGAVKGFVGAASSLLNTGIDLDPGGGYAFSASEDLPLYVWEADNYSSIVGLKSKEEVQGNTAALIGSILVSRGNSVLTTLRESSILRSIKIPYVNKGSGSNLAATGLTNPITDAEAAGYSYYEQFRTLDGMDWKWPQNLGFMEKPVESVLPVGTKLDRYGSPNGVFLSPKNTLYDQRALAPGSMANGYHEYEVIKPLPVLSGKVSPAFDQPGGGIQILPNLPNKVDVQWLIRNEYLREVH